jgi:hypothetical protein
MTELLSTGTVAATTANIMSQPDHWLERWLIVVCILIAVSGRWTMVVAVNMSCHLHHVAVFTFDENIGYGGER